ncbi:MAG: hydrolase 1, exosortase A system-associated, partial [Phycisphaerales bacterium]|nr:hydrolase 1, exosortase A system-associated [Phycisphaerales bacterium]
MTREGLDHRLAAERPLWFDVDGETLLGILHPACADARVGVVVVVGGPQYRVGSHRQFVLLARDVAAAGYPVLRFDYRGMGDSSGAARDFEAIEPDVDAAIAVLKAETGVERVVLWGLCDAASAALIHARRSTPADALILLNPWVHTEQGEARVRLKTYYLRRLLSRDLWHKIVRLEFDVSGSLRSLLGYVRQIRGRGAGDDGPAHYVDRMLDGLRGFNGPLYVILSGDDLTASEFRELIAGSRAWREAWQACCR